MVKKSNIKAYAALKGRTFLLFRTSLFLPLRCLYTSLHDLRSEKRNSTHLHTRSIRILTSIAGWHCRVSSITAAAEVTFNVPITYTDIRT